MGTIYLIVESHGELHAEEKKAGGKEVAGAGKAADAAVVEVVVPTVELTSAGRRPRSASSAGERPALPNIGKYDDLEQDAKRCCMVETFDGARVDVKKMLAASPVKESFVGVATAMGSASLPNGHMTSLSAFSGSEAGFLNGRSREQTQSRNLFALSLLCSVARVSIPKSRPFLRFLLYLFACLPACPLARSLAQARLT